MTFGGGFGRVFRPVFDPGLTARNGLLNTLIAYWPGNEASGNLLDAHTNALTLSQINTASSATGKVYATARYFEWSGAYRADNALLGTGDVDWTVAFWYKLKTDFGGGVYLGKHHDKVSNIEWFVSPVGLTVSANGTTQNALAKTLTSATWQFVVCWHDAVADTINIQTDNGTVSSKAHTGGTYDGTARFALCTDGDGHNWTAGTLSPIMFWKSSAGGGGVLTAAQRTALWANGNGLAYANFTT